MKEIYEKIKEYDVITIFGHVFPDGDCYGSQIGLKEAIKTTFPHKQVYALGSGFSKFLPFAKMDVVSDDIIKNSLAIVLDVANVERIEDQRFSMAREIIKIDHHIFVHKFGSIELVDIDAIATAQIIARIIKENNMQLSKLGANCLMLGIITDSGRFQYGETNAETFALAEYLMQNGVDLHNIYNILYETDLKDIKCKGYILNNIKTDKAIIYFKVTYQESLALDISPENVAGYVNLLSNIKGYPIWCSFSERENGQIRCELRSINPEYNVQVVASKYGGGGHIQAAGCRVSSFEEVNNLLDDLNKLYNKE